MCAESRKDWIVVNQSGADCPPLVLNFSDIRKVALVMRASDNNLRQKMTLLIEHIKRMTVTSIQENYVCRRQLLRIILGYYAGLIY